MIDSDCTRILRDAIVANHIEFLRTHRGRVERDGAITRCVSEKAPFCFALVHSGDAFRQELAKERTLYIPSWLTVPDHLGARLRLSHSLTYMLRDDGQSAPCARVVRAQTPAEMDDFVTVQARGFGDDDPADIAEWRPFLGRAGRANLTNPRQAFFVDYDSGSAVACSLSVYAASIAGIYAVATVPSARRQGRAAALLNHAASNAAARGVTILGLQTETGSDAERLYSAQGFQPLFHMRVFKV
jgi:GNAT superfamily N-acetyltransferase